MATDQLATLMRAAGHLQTGDAPDPELLDALAAMILRWSTTAPATREPRLHVTVAQRARPAAAPVENARSSSAPAPTRPVPEPAGGPPPGRAARKQARRLIAEPSSLRQVEERADLDVPRRAAAIDAMPTEPRTTEPAGNVAPLASLFRPSRVRGILRELATLQSASGPLDIAVAIALIARATSITRLPRRFVSTLGHSLQLLFDVGPAMIPFAHDKRQLAATTIRVFGRDRVRVADFISSPLQRVRAHRQVRWEAFHWPARRSAMVVVSDLGIGASDTDTQTDEWRRFVDQANARGLRSVVLIPYPRERWPGSADAFDTALTWDIETGVQALHRRARRRDQPW